MDAGWNERFTLKVIPSIRIRMFDGGFLCPVEEIGLGLAIGALFSSQAVYINLIKCIIYQFSLVNLSEANGYLLSPCYLANN